MSIPIIKVTSQDYKSAGRMYFFYETKERMLSVALRHAESRIHKY